MVVIVTYEVTLCCCALNLKSWSRLTDPRVGYKGKTNVEDLEPWQQNLP